MVKKNIKLSNLRVSDFNFDLPESLIATRPLKERDESRLMVLHRKDGSIEHKIFKEVIDYYDKDDCFVFNDTKVIPARLYGKKDKNDATIEVFLLRELNESIKMWDVLVNPARKIRISNKIEFGEGDGLIAEVVDNTVNGGRAIRFLYNGNHEEFKEFLYSIGTPPIPEYMHRVADEEDRERYQTIYAKHEGAVVAPAAGLHFNKILLKRMELKDIRLAWLTLHNGLGNYENQDIEDPSKHRKNNEEMIVPLSCCETTKKAKEAGKRIVAVGTSTLRALETAVSTDGLLKEYNGWTNKYIYPPYNMLFVDDLISNFHMPCSLLLMNVAGVGGYDEVMNAYEVAIKEGYRFGAYGDAMLITE